MLDGNISDRLADVHLMDITPLSLGISIKGSLSNEDVERIIRDAANKQDEDKKERDRILARNNLESYAHWIVVMIKECTESIKKIVEDKQQEQIKKRCDEVLYWLYKEQVDTTFDCLR
ncbi:hypothetical protein LSH36_2830g00002 [Paralvinella palmiformis]|uniref:Uncharacterized protein n=1 Tax=Paralvinella palmiformis TaxID=53620 RepID=A0AAD9IPK1_9ANNE|nr:hypothetical protein LSH36_2830g00002 [Paralvinella palmiformis]